MIVLWAWLTAGVLRVLVPAPDAALAPGPAGGRLGLGEVGTVLAVVDLLFLAFVRCSSAISSAAPSWCAS